MMNKSMRYIAALLMSLPVLSLSLAALAWLRYGMDMPWFDDWRGYAEGNIGSFNPSYLFRAVNDTLAPVGFALDAVAQHLLDGNSVPYQFLSMTVVLGSLLLLQWTLLHKILGSKFLAAVCFSFTVLMLQPGSYWGLENLAYHQALPLVFILTAMWIIVCSDVNRAWQFVAVPLLGTVAGLTYISGAFAVLTAGTTLVGVAASCHTGTTRRRMMGAAALFTLAGALTSGAQFYLSLLKFHSAGTHAGIPMALPVEASFWMFYLGKVGRSLLLPQSYREMSFAITALVCVATICIAIVLFRRARAHDSTQRDKRLAGIYIPLLALIFVYLMLVAAGRANFRGPEITDRLDIFALGFTRFHFFWATLLWPWAVAGIISIAGRGPWTQRLSVRAGGVALVLGLAVIMFRSGAYGHMAFQRDLAARRLPVAQCLLQELQRGGEIRCPGLLPSRFTELAPDAYPAYLNARKMGASFVRYFPLLPRSKRRADLVAFYEMAPKNATAGLSQLEHVSHETFRAVGGDPQLSIEPGQPQTMRRCTTLDVDVDMKAGIADMAQVFFQPLGAPAFEERHSSRLPVGDEAGAYQTLTFRLESTVGFRDTLRIDPVTQPQSLEMKGIRVYCIRQQP